MTTDEVRARKRAYARRYYERNKEVVKARARRWYLANRERAEAARRGWADANPEKMLAYKRKHMKATEDAVRDKRLRAAYGISLADYRAMYAAQNGRCAICGREEGRHGRGQNPDRSRPLSVDHDHETGVVRGLLCNWCNRTLGRFDHDASRFENAAAYLRQYQTEAG